MYTKRRQHGGRGRLMDRNTKGGGKSIERRVKEQKAHTVRRHVDAQACSVTLDVNGLTAERIAPHARAE